eukprot:GEMP01009526.1.p1 GENE.GEMP01009526.1~~GEMP01009526.1.p1  ORF type:complete len:359 (+),score=75.18 GEMP01009526.1:138-1214(+)
MGATESVDLHPSPTPAHNSRAIVFVLHDGQYEPQMLMPVAPNMDTIFDGSFDSRNRPFRTVNPPELKKTNLVKNPTHVRRETMAIATQGGNTYLEFSFDSKCSVTVSVDMLNGDGPFENPEELAMMEDPPIVFPTKKFPAKLMQHYSARLGPINEVVEAHGQAYFVIAMKVATPTSDMMVRGQKTYLSVNRNENPIRKKSESMKDRPLRADVISQALDIANKALVTTDVCKATPDAPPEDSTVYQVQEVYGIKPDTDPDGGRECIICMSEPRDTVVLPCRHMAFCSSCANIMRTRCEKCPICRQRVATLLQFSLSDDTPAAVPKNDHAVLNTRKSENSTEASSKSERKSAGSSNLNQL